jgi:pyruvate-formate lyase-activating enzyme
MTAKNDIIPMFLYGAGKRLKLIYSQYLQYNVVGIVDSNIGLHDTSVLVSENVKLPVYSLKKVLCSYPKACFVISADIPVKFEIQHTLLLNGVAKERIVNYEEYTTKESCWFLETMLVFGEGYIPSCCYTEDVPKFRFVSKWSQDVFDNNLSKFYAEIHKDISEKKGCCYKCEHLKTLKVSKRKRLKTINLITGSVCQFKCSYCGNVEHFSLEREDNLKFVLQIIKYYRTKGLIDCETRFLISNGEITINPLKEMIYTAIGENPCTIYTNAEYYSVEIENILKKRDDNYLNISLDAGTEQTFLKIKGRNCFNQVKDNIIRYSKYAKIQLKYVIMTGANTKYEDAGGFCQIAEQSNADIVISRNAYETQLFDDNFEVNIKVARIIADFARNKGLNVINIMNSFKNRSSHCELIESV